MQLPATIHKADKNVIGSAAGIAVFTLWASLLGQATAFIPDLASPQAQGLNNWTRPAFYAGLVICGILMMILNMRIIPVRIFLDSAFAVVICLATVGYGIAWQQSLFDPVALATACSLLLGWGFAWFISAICLHLATRAAMQPAAMAVVAGLALGYLLGELIGTVAPVGAQVVIGVALALLGCLILLALDRQEEPALDESKAFSRAEQNYQLIIILLMVLCAFVMRAISRLGFWGYPHGLLTETLAGVALAATASSGLFVGIAWLLVIRRVGLPLQRRYQALLLLVISGCLVWLLHYWLFPDFSHPLADLAVNALALFGELALWAVAIASLQTLRFGGYRILGAISVVYGLLSGFWISLFNEAETLLVAAVLAVVFVVLLVMVGFPSLFSNMQGQPETSANPRDDVQVISDRYSLTPRETEILVYLVHGRSRPYIQEKLFMSDGTIKTHTTHIYAKLGVHTRQQLLDLVEDVDSRQE